MGDVAAEVIQGESVGFFAIGASLHDTLTYIKSQPLLYPSIDFIYSAYHPLQTPIVVRLAPNGIQLRFDSPQQRLRVIEVTDFTKMKFNYKNHDIVRLEEGAGEDGFNGPPTSGPLFKNIYKLFGPTTPGEYVPPNPAKQATDKGVYCLSYPGISFNFWVDASAWSPSLTWSSIVSLLSSSATSPAWSMGVFHGESWPKARRTIYTTELPPQFSLTPAFGRDHKVKDIELAKIHGEGRIELVRRDATPIWIITGETTMQDLVTELGPPDTTYKKASTTTAKSPRHRRGTSHSRSRRPTEDSLIRPSPSSLGPSSYNDGDISSSAADSASDWETDEDENDSDEQESFEAPLEGDQIWFNYYRHGIDVLFGTVTEISGPSPTAPRTDPTLATTNNGDSPHHNRDNSPPGAPSSSDQQQNPYPTSRTHPTAAKIHLSSNLPGSYTFNRHRRLRWSLDHVPSPNGRHTSVLTSEMPWRDIRGRLREVFASTYKDPTEERAQQQPMALNRGWGGESSLGASVEFLGGWDEGAGNGGAASIAAPTGRKRAAEASGSSAASAGPGAIGSTELYGFPGMVFEVMKNGAVAGLLVY